MAGSYIRAVNYNPTESVEAQMPCERNFKYRVIHATTRVLPIVLVLILTGCGKKNGIAVYPVKGTVRHAGAPAAGAKVVLYAIDRQDATIPFPTGIVQSDGSFTLTSYSEGDGAPAGAYNVAVEWHEPIPAGTNRETFTPHDRLRGKFANPERSNLKATVEAGDNELPPFELN
jgi:hypothetical protein